MESHQEDQKDDSRLDFYKQDGNLVIVDSVDNKVYTIKGEELDFEITKNQNLNKNEEKTPIKNKIKSDAIMNDEKKEPKTEDMSEKNEKKMKYEDEDEDEDKEKKKDMTKDAKTEIIDGQHVKTEAEGDDDRVEYKIKGDPYNETESYDKKHDKGIDVADMIKLIEAQETRINELEKSKDLISKLAKNQEANDMAEKDKIQGDLQEDPYGLALDTIKDLTLEQLRAKKESYDQLPMIQDFFKSDEYLTHEDVNRNAVDMAPLGKTDGRDMVLQKAQTTFKDNIGEKRYEQDFGGM